MVRRAVSTVVILLGLVALAYGQQDPLAFFNGVWVSVNPPGPHVIFSKIGLDQREASLPVIGPASIRVSDGRDGSNFKVSGPGFDCYYIVSRINAREMTWDLKSGSPACPKSTYFKKVEEEADHRASNEAVETARICREVEGISSLDMLGVLERQHRGRAAADCIAARIAELRRRERPVIRDEPQPVIRGAVPPFNPAAVPSFDCVKYAATPLTNPRKNPQTDLFCIDPQVARVDFELGQVFQSSVSGLSASAKRDAIDIQNQWTWERNRRCPATWDDLAVPARRNQIGQCLMRETYARLRELGR